MKRTCVILVFWFCSTLGTVARMGEDSARFILKRLTPRIHLLQDTQQGGGQLGIMSEQGMILLDSFSSAPTARTYREEWGKAEPGRNIAYVINTVDRLDIFGGNAAFSDIPIVGHQVFHEKFTPEAVAAEVKRLIAMWRWKEDVSRRRQPTHKPGSAEAENERRWTAFCQRRAGELEKGFHLLLPRITYSDRMTLYNGDLSVELIALGDAGYNGLTIVVVPEEKTAVISGFILHSQHLAPHPQKRWVRLDVPRWIRILKELTAENGRIDRYIVDTRYLWTRAQVRSHLRYLETLWRRVAELEAAGQSLETIQDRLSLEKEFAFVKQMQAYREHGDAWIRPQHEVHVWNFFVQHKQSAARLIRKLMTGHDAETAIRMVRARAQENPKIYFDEGSINDLGYGLLRQQQPAAARVVLQMNTELFPRSANAWDSLGEAWMKAGDSIRAAECYQKSLELNPRNETARRMLEKLKNT